MKTFVFTILCCAIIFSACKKKTMHFDMVGKVVQQNNLQAVSDASINVYSYGYGTNTKKLEKSATTDANGNYNVNLNRGKFEKVVVEASKNNYFTSSGSILFDNLSTENNNTINLQISPKSWIKFILTNTTGFPDTLRIQKVKGKTGCTDCAALGNYYFYGTDTSFTWPNDGGTYTTFHFWINDSIHVFDSVYTTPFQTTNYSIDY